jgi:lipoprotein-anchoring transpeptidase ErfK/SrfK
VVISLVEQAMRVYQNGQLIQAFFITSGRPELPSTPGIWQELRRSSPTTLVSALPNNSPYWFPKTRVNYAMLYSTGGHLIVDSSWRGTYGPGTQFPHRDANGDTFASNGTEGGIDMAEQDAGWLYTNTSLKTRIVIY